MLRAIVGTLIGLSVTGCGRTSGGVDIWQAVEQDDVDAIRNYQVSGGNLNVRSWGGSTPLWTALEGKNRSSYEVLLECGADPNVIMSGGRVVMHWAAIEQDPWWLRLALEHGADLNPVNVGRGRPFEGTPMSFAISDKGTLENVKLLVEHGADINKPLRHNCYPLASALSQNKWDVVLYLLDRGADYARAECGEQFLKHFRELYEMRHQGVFRLKEDRDKLDEIHAWLKAKGVDLGQS